ncbi:MAG: transcriptional regulator [bacterium]|nr:MAG: transcriptional regulator [bacterium]
MAADKKESDELKQVVDIDRVIHEPARFLILAYLYVVESADFLFLMNQTGLTRGNLSSHLSKLDASGYVHIQKEFVNKMPRTILSLSDEGRKAFNDYRQMMKYVLDDLPE